MFIKRSRRPKVVTSPPVAVPLRSTECLRSCCSHLHSCMSWAHICICVQVLTVHITVAALFISISMFFKFELKCKLPIAKNRLQRSHWSANTTNKHTVARHAQKKCYCCCCCFACVFIDFSSAGGLQVVYICLCSLKGFWTYVVLFS